MKDLLFLVFLIVDLDLIKCSSALLVNARIAQAVIGVFLAPTILGHISSKYVLTALAILKGAILGGKGCSHPFIQIFHSFPLLSQLF
jgi:hypothetical protein